MNTDGEYRPKQSRGTVNHDYETGIQQATLCRQWNGYF